MPSVKLPQNEYLMTNEATPLQYHSGFERSEAPFKGVNYWVATKDIRFANWRITLPAKQWSATDCVNFGHNISQYGKQNDIFQLSSIGDFEFKPNTFVENYMAYVRWYVNENNTLPLLNFGSVMSDEAKFVTPSEVYLYRNPLWVGDEIVENVGQILKILRADALEKFGNTFMSPVAPISFYGSEVTPDNFSQEVQIEIVLHTDIWFPKVIGLMEDMPATNESTLYDNRQLAYRHTLPLNNFLRNVQKFVIDFGGIWEVDSSQIHPLYQAAVTETGITIDEDIAQKWWHNYENKNV